MTFALYSDQDLDQNYQLKACLDRSNDLDLQIAEYVSHFQQNIL